MKTAILVLVLMLVAPEVRAQYPAAVASCILCSSQPGLAPIQMDRSSDPALPPAMDFEDRGSLAGSIVGGVVGGAVGGLVLGYVGYHVFGGGQICGDDSCGLVGGALGLVLGEMIGMGVGVHIGNGRHGSVGSDIAVAFAAGWAGAGLVARFAGDATLPAALVLQLGLTIAVERGYRGVSSR